MFEDERPLINGVPALADSFRMRVNMGENGMAGSKRAIARGVAEDGTPYYEYEDALARPNKVRERILDPFVDEPYMAAHAYIHSDLFKEDMEDIFLVPEFDWPEEEAGSPANIPAEAAPAREFPPCEQRLLDLTVECRNRNVEGDDWRELVTYVNSAGRAPRGTIHHQYVANRGYITDGVRFEKASLRWEALMMAGPARENWPLLVKKYPVPPIHAARGDLDTIEFLGDAYVTLTMASRRFREFFIAEKVRLGL